MISTKKQDWFERRFLTRREALNIHAFHNASFWMALLFTGLCPVVLMAMGVGIIEASVIATVLLVYAASVAGTLTDLMSMRIPDRISLLVIVGALAWWALESRGLTSAEGIGNGRDMLGLFLPGQGSGSIVPDLTGAFPASWLALDVIAGVLVFIPLMASFLLGLGFGGGDVKLMTALVFFLGWPLGFDFVILTYFFGALISMSIILLRQFARIARRAGFKSKTLVHLSEVRSFAYAPAILAAALLCIAQKAEGIIS